MILSLTFIKRDHFFLRRYLGIILLCLVGIILAYTVFFTVNYYEQQRRSQQFETRFKDKVTSLTQTISSIDKVFLATKSLLNIKRGLLQQDFAQLITHDFLQNTGLLGVQWAPAVDNSQVNFFEQQVRATGVFDYQIRAMSNTSENCSDITSNTLFPVLFAQPAEFIGHTLGLQLTSNCTIARGMNQAWKNNSISAAHFTNEHNELGFRLLLPIFENELTANAKLRGYLVGIVMTNQLIETIWGNIARSKNHKISIFNNYDKSQKIYDSQWRNDCIVDCYFPAPQSMLQATIPFANQLWTIEFTQYGLGVHSRSYALAAAVFVLILTLGLSLYLWMYINRVRWANALVKEKTESLQYQASHDDLTKLLNKITLTNELDKQIEQKKCQVDNGFSLLFIDLDHFKKVNDTQGHLVGDKLLQQVAQRLQKVARSDDLLFRFGGDEFAVLLKNNVCPAAVILIAKRILDKLVQVYLIDNNQYRIGASIGISIMENNNISANEMIRNADIAMYEAKRLGRGQVVFYQTNMHQTLVNKQDIEDELADAIANKHLSLYLQPIHENRNLKGFEALSRWHHDEKGIIFPDEFIAVAEETGLIHLLGEWVIETSCAQLALWLAQYGEKNCPYISINVSPIQLAQGEVVTQIEQALKKYDVPGELLAIELTESALINNKTIVKENLMKIQQWGVRVFLDDFGTGFSSLSLLRDFPIDVLKIDRSFIVDVANREGCQDSKKLVKAIINMSQALHMSVVAEGVEDLRTLNWLNKAGCYLIQGYYFSKPLSPADAVEYLAKQKTLSTVVTPNNALNYPPLILSVEI
ncbi:MAG: bifunctional diguanylate cyclase/phosphodiesterase [Colwellia sp.]